MSIYSDADIMARLPHPEPRPGQIDAIRFVLDSFAAGKRFAFLEAPTGSGKSAVGLTVADFYDRSFYLTIQKILQAQISRDYAGAQLVELKGRNAYPCTFYRLFGPALVQAGKWRQDILDKQIARDPHCDDGYCYRHLERFKCRACFPPTDRDGTVIDPGWLRRQGVQHSTCPYYEQVGLAREARKVLMNFSSFLHQTGFTDRFGPRDLLIVDECLHPHTKIRTDRGIIQIDTIVDRHIDCNVLSYNEATGVLEHKPIVRWLRRDRRQTYRVLVGNDAFCATEDHKIYTLSGLVKLRDLKVGDQVLTLDSEVTTTAQHQLLLGPPQEPKLVRPQSILSITPYEETVTYDLEVADNHNFVAGNTIVSNCHNCEEQLMNFVSVSISDRDFASAGLGLPELAEAAEYAIWLLDNDVLTLLTDMIGTARKLNNLKRQEELLHTRRRVERFIKYIEDGMTDWVHELKEHRVKDQPTYRTVTIKPVFVSHFANELLWRYGGKVLLMSATILDARVMARALGIDKDDMVFYRLPNSFPVNNRPIFVIPALKATGGKDNQHTWGPAMVKWVDGIVRKYRDKRGIIHTHNFSIANMLMSQCRERQRFLFQEVFRDKEEMLQAHAEQPDSVLVAPALYEGLDLKDDLSRFQIICKTPYPNFFDDKQLAARIENDRRFLVWLVALRLVQAYGRSIRSADDWAHTYIIDGAVTRFLAEADRMLPDWFKEAIVHVPVREITAEGL